MTVKSYKKLSCVTFGLWYQSFGLSDHAFTLTQTLNILEIFPLEKLVFSILFIICYDHDYCICLRCCFLYDR